MPGNDVIEESKRDEEDAFVNIDHNFLSRVSKESD